jgi:type IV pilus assembly protein PilQ
MNDAVGISRLLWRPALVLLLVGAAGIAPARAEVPAGDPSGATSPVAAATSVTGAQISADGNKTTVRITLAATGATPTVSPFRQSNPERVVLDIAGATLAAGATAPAGGVVQGAQFSTFNDGADNVRLTLTLSSAATWDIRSEGGAIVLTLTPGAVSDPLADALKTSGADDSSRLSGPLAPQTGPTLTSLDFQQKDRISRVIIGTQEAAPAVSQAEKNVIAVDVPGAKIPDSLKRELDTRFFYSAVDSVRAAQTRAGARVTIRLREGAEYEVKKENGLTILEIQIPQDQIEARTKALQQAAPAAPATPDTNGGKGISNATGTEVLITGGGRTIDPQGIYTGASQAGTFAFASEATSASTPHGTGRRMSIDLQDADIHTVFSFIADFADINIVASDDVKGKVTVRLKDVPWDEALGSVLNAKGLAAQRYGSNIIRVAPLETIKAEEQAHLEAQRAKFDATELTTYIAPLNYAQADDLMDQVKAVLSSRGTVQVDTRGNQMIVHDTEQNVAQVRELLRHLDTPNRQVSIEARFVEANSTFTRNLGIQWGGNLDASAATGYPTGAFFPSDIGAMGGMSTVKSGSPLLYTAGGTDNLLVDLGAASSSSAIDFNFGSIGGLINIDARLSALESEGWGKIISNPRVQTLDNEKASIQQGARIPYLSTSNGGTQVQFVNATLELDVTPHVTAEGTVFLDLKLRNNRPDYSNLVQGQPAIQIKEIETRVLVADGDTAVLGGVYATSDSFQSGRVPGLGSIPIIGYLFKSSSKQRQQNEMLVFITPRVVPLETASASTSNGG